VDHGCLEAAAADLSSAVRAIDERLGRLDGDLRPLHADWTGEAQWAYVVAQATWTRAMGDLRGILAQAAVDVADANSSYLDADRRGARGFGG
jgi:early secretory antigenic target protein ESAT-6